MDFSGIALAFDEFMRNVLGVATRMDPSLIVKMLTEAFGVSLSIFGLTLLGSIPLGVIVALCRLSRFKPLAWIMRIYISFMRGTPLMLQMLAVMFGPYYLFGIETGNDYKFTACIIAFVANYTAYFAEIYRSGIQSMPKGQYEAAEVLGYTRAQTFFKIILPQVIKRIIPAMGNEIVTLVKDTSLAFSIGVAEMFTQAKALVASQRNMLPFFISALIYWAVCLLIEFVLGRVEKKLSYYHD